MKHRIIFSLLLSAVLILSFQRTISAAGVKSLSGGKHETAVLPNCPVPVKNLSVTPGCIQYPPPPCVDTSCYGLDPYTEGCGTATTYNQISYVSTPIEDPSVVYGYLTNYYSSWCIANWAVVSLTKTGYSSSVSTWVQISTSDINGKSEQMCYPDICYPFSYYTGAAYPTWTNMVDGTHKTYAFLYIELAGVLFYIHPIEADQ